MPIGVDRDYRPAREDHFRKPPEAERRREDHVARSRQPHEIVKPGRTVHRVRKVRLARCFGRHRDLVPAAEELPGKSLEQLFHSADRWSEMATVDEDLQDISTGLARNPMQVSGALLSVTRREGP